MLAHRTNVQRSSQVNLPTRLQRRSEECLFYNLTVIGSPINKLQAYYLILIANRDKMNVCFHESCVILYKLSQGYLETRLNIKKKDVI